MSIFDAAADEIAKSLIAADQTICVAESSTGGLISANLLSVPGASQFYIGGSVVYTLKSRHAFLDFERERLRGLKPLTEEMVLEFARAARAKLDTTWAIAELGAAGPTGTPYGHAAGTSVIGVVGPVEAALKIETGSNNRQENMLAFTAAALKLMHETLAAHL